jgi:hypothetical protein
MAGRPRGAHRRRSKGRWWWSIYGAPVTADAARDLFAGAVWELIRGAGAAATPSQTAVGRRYAEVLLENLGQPGFRELVLVATDLDARRDLVAALVREPFRADFVSTRENRERRAELLDLTGAGREHAIDVMAAGLTPPVVCEPALLTFGADSFWRGETHRTCDRAGCISRVLEEVARAGATQAILITAAASQPQPHQLRPSRLDPRGRLGDVQAAAEAASLRDALEMARLRFDAVYVIAPSHNPVGPFDLRGSYDEASDRQYAIDELMERASEDAYRQFIEPVVGASGEQLAQRGAAATPHGIQGLN